MNQVYSRTFLQRNKILGLGMSYTPRNPSIDKSTLPKEPLVFGKPLSTLCFNPKVLDLKQQAQYPIMYEVELGVMIKKTGYRIPQHEALSYVGGYFLCLDLTTQMLAQLRKESKGLVLCKGGDNFTPCSELIETELVENPDDLDLLLEIDGQVRQYCNTKELLFNVAWQVSYLSNFFTLNEGDMILTGTPEGPNNLEHGQEVYASLKQSQKILAELKFKVNIETHQ